MGLVQKDATRTALISYFGIILGYVNKGVLFILFLTTEEIGLLNLLFSLGALFAQFSNFGLAFSVWKFFPFMKDSKSKHRGFFSYTLLIACLGILIFFFLSVFCRNAIQMQYLEKSPLFLVYYYWFIPIGVATGFYLYFDVYLRSLYKNIISVIAQDVILRITFSLLLILFGLDLISFDQLIIWHGLIYFVPPLILGLYLMKIGEFSISRKNIKIPRRMKKIIFQYSSINYVNTIGSVLLNSLDVIMLAQFVGLASAGVFSTIMFLINAFLIPYRSIVRISSPLVAEYWKERNFDKMQSIYQKVSSVCLFIGLSMFLVFWLNIEFLFSFLNPEFEIGIWIFLYLMVARLVDMYFGLNGAIFTTSKKYKYDLIFTIVLVSLAYGLKLFFIPWWGSVGAAFSTAIAIIVYNLGRILFVYLAFKIHPFQKEQFVIIALSIVTLLLGFIIQKIVYQPFLKLFINLLTIGFTFFLPVYIFKLESESINYFKNLKALVLKRKYSERNKF
jgi:O-antigen/teichoic acid export membrane protein